DGAGTKMPLFDHARLVEALSKAAPASKLNASHLDVISAAPTDSGGTVTVRVGPDSVFVCDLNSYTCVPKSLPVAKPDELPSPDGTQSLGARSDNLWVRDVSDGKERQLTTDGLPYFSYGKSPDTSLTAIVAQRAKRPQSPVAAIWSPDGRKVVAARTDERSI